MLSSKNKIEADCGNWLQRVLRTTLTVGMIPLICTSHSVAQTWELSSLDQNCETDAWIEENLEPLLEKLRKRIHILATSLPTL